MDENEKWNAVTRNDYTYDGTFFFAVKTTGIYCRPSCKAKLPLRKNTLFFDSSEEAEKSGFRPCKLCRPDIKSNRYNPNENLIAKVKAHLELNFNDSIDLNALPEIFGCSHSNLSRLFKEQTGITLATYLLNVRISIAKKLLVEPSLSIIDISHEAGFKSNSTFYRCFKKAVGQTPSEYRKKGNKNALL